MSNTKTVMSQAANTQGIPLDITDVFSTYLYEGTSAAQTITNGIDLAGEGGLVWLKGRGASNHHLIDTERGSDKYLLSNVTNAEKTSPAGSDVTSFNSDGFSFGTYYSNINFNGYDYASWTFRKAPKFFDVVTFEVTRDGSNNLTSTSSNVTITNGEVTVDHNLGVAPAIWIQKNTTTAGAWYVRSTIAGTVGGYGQLNGTNAWAAVGNWTFPSTATQVGFGDYGFFQSGTNTYVAYLFAHNDGDGEFGPDGDQDIIKCGSYTGNGSSNGPEIDLGWEPQWVMIKNATSTGPWVMLDNMRGWPVTNDTTYTDHMLWANTSDAEYTTVKRANITSTGFQIRQSNSQVNTSGDTYIYMAIRRGPLAPPESGTEVFAPVLRDGSPLPSYKTGFPVDAAIWSYRPGFDHRMVTRLLGGTYLETNTTDVETSWGTPTFDYNTGWGEDTSASTDHISHAFRRAPNFFDVVAYTGDGVAGRTVSHNLGVAPEMMWVKPRSAANPWQVYHSATGNTKALNFDTGTGYTSINYWNNTTPSSSDFTLGSSVGFNGSGVTYIAYLFATLAGVSKVFSVTKSSGSDASVDCGFTSGPRFVMLKRTDSTGDWYVWDTERGIVAGNDPYLLLNSTAAEVTSTDYIDPTSNGFTIVNGGLADGDYIGYAVA